MKQQVRKYIECNLKNIMLFVIIYVIGMAIGFFVFGFLGAENKAELISSISNTVELSNSEGFTKVSIIKNGLQINAILTFLFVFSAFTVVSFGIVSAIIFFRGMSLSIYICILFNVFGVLKGLLCLIPIAIIPNLILLIVYIFLGIECIKVSNEILIRINMNRIIKSLFKLMVFSLMTLPFIVLSNWIEQVFFRIIIAG